MSGAIPKFWTEERCEQLRSLWDAGNSASVIGQKLGCSRNAVIGKVHRLNLDTRNCEQRRVALPRRRLPPKQRLTLAASAGGVLKSVKPDAAPLFVPGKACSILEVTGCRWPVAESNVPGGHLFCNAVQAPGKSYCPHHAHINVASYSSTLIKQTLSSAISRWRRTG